MQAAVWVWQQGERGQGRVVVAVLLVLVKVLRAASSFSAVAGSAPYSGLVCCRKHPFLCSFFFFWESLVRGVDGEGGREGGVLDGYPGGVR